MSTLINDLTRTLAAIAVLISGWGCTTATNSELGEPSTNMNPITRHYFEDMDSQYVECGEISYSVEEQLNRVRESLKDYLRTRSAVGLFSSDKLLAHLTNAENLISFGYGNVNSQPQIVFGFLDPDGDQALGSTIGIDIVATPCDWTVLELAVWEGPDQ